jgi:ATP-dependent Clp protease adaptor protein ClpS
MPAIVEKTPSPVKKTYPKYRVILHNDDHNDMGHVVSSLLEVVPSLSEQAAYKVMMTAHIAGKATVIVCDLEPAEFYCEGLKSKGLSSSIEKE